jgi:hypothetical protein
MAVSSRSCRNVKVFRYIYDNISMIATGAKVAFVLVNEL